MAAELVSLSPLDEARFGIRTARASHVTAAALPDVLAYCAANDIRLLIARCRAEDLAAAQAMEASGFFLTDTLVYWSRDLSPPIPERDPEAAVRPARADEATAVAAVAAEAFKGYFGHYHADPRLDPAACDETYAHWARRSCMHTEVAETVLVSEAEGRIVGFLTLRRNSPEEAEIVLNGVLPSSRRKGVYRSLAVEAMRWSVDRACRTLIVSTQLVNFPVQKAWARLGFTLTSAFHTFHRWFD